MSVALTSTRQVDPAGISQVAVGRLTTICSGRPGVVSTRTGATSRLGSVALRPWTCHSETKSWLVLPVEVSVNRTVGAPATTRD